MTDPAPTLADGRSFTEIELVFLRALHRIEAKVDQVAARLEPMATRVEKLVDALDVEAEPAELDLEGDDAGVARDQTQSLDQSDPK